MKDEVQHIVGSLVKSSADGGGEKESYVGSDRELAREWAKTHKNKRNIKLVSWRALQTSMFMPPGDCSFFTVKVAITKALAIAAQKGHIKHDIVIPTGPTPGMPPRVEYVKVQDWSADASPSPKKRVWQNLHSRLGEGMIPGVEDIVYQVQAGMTKPDVDAPAGSISKALGCHVRAYDAGAKGPVRRLKKAQRQVPNCAVAD
ncbi:hypothetical protein, conserved [Eimeria maxima]|uniref:Uncharacterized protein n=1 Tax=Eimeria maxima TaxID=5804 RepID=U6M634_EIMMA|nr:hypothetical protein, conserved [Eimeria maxima]CDJ59496.1 hypothetical protein, conserved [Eimeria maxima]